MMQAPELTVRSMESADIPLIARYWRDADPAYLRSLGADPDKIPEESDLTAMLSEQLRQPVAEKTSFCLIWIMDGEPVGHSNANKIEFGASAFMHLHLWRQELRHLGLGVRFVRLSLPWFFEHLQLKTLYCEPYAHNAAPNKTLEKAGFQFVRRYWTIPGSINFEQEVHLWEMTAAHFETISKTTTP